MLRNALITACFVLITGIAWAEDAVEGDGPIEGGGPWDVTIFHTNDSHSAFFPREAHWRKDRKMVGGIIPLAWHLEDQRHSTKADILLDAGDFMTGNPVCQLTDDDGVPGVAIARMMSGVGYDAGVVGNHEFDVGADLTKKLMKHFSYPLFGGDIIDADGNPAYRREPIILERNGLRIGVFGFSCQGMTEVVTASKLMGLRMADQATIAREVAAEIDDETDLIVIITHNGVDNDKVLAQALTGSGIDVIVGGHSHSRLKKPVLENGILIVQAGSKMTNLGRLDLQVKDDRVAMYNGQLIDLWSDGTFANDELNAMVTGYENQVMAEYGEEIGTLAVDLRKGRGEHNLGNWLADCLRAGAKADVALINSGGIRRPLSAGPLTALDIHEMLPFANNLISVKISGEKLSAIIQQNADAGVSGVHGILQVSGVRYSYRPTADGEAAELVEVLVDGKAIVADEEYVVAMPDYVAMMKDEIGRAHV